MAPLFTVLPSSWSSLIDLLGSRIALALKNKSCLSLYTSTSTAKNLHEIIVFCAALAFTDWRYLSRRLTWHL